MDLLLKQVVTSERKYFEELRDTTFAYAQAEGLEVVRPCENQIQLDLDFRWEWSDPQLNGMANVIDVICSVDPRVREVFYRLCEQVVFLDAVAWESKGGNCHVMLTLAKELPVAERIALQSILGSDPMREMLNLRRVWCGAEDPIALFKPKAGQ